MSHLAYKMGTMDNTQKPLSQPLRAPMIGANLVMTSAVARWIAEVPAHEESRGTFVANAVRTHAAQVWDDTDLDDEDKQSNLEAAVTGARILSAHVYTDASSPEPVRIWVITEAVGGDGKRSATTVLFVSDY